VQPFDQLAAILAVMGQCELSLNGCSAHRPEATETFW
jgi:hypothetical protein